MMRWLGLRRRRPGAVIGGETPATDAMCLHITLVPRWDNAGDIGHDDRASQFRCDACGQQFSPDEASTLRATEAERLRARSN